MTAKTKSEGMRDRVREKKGLNRREMLKASAAAGVGAAALTGAKVASAQTASDVEWDYEVDVVVIGSGGTGLPAAIRAAELGAEVLVVEQNFEIGGRMYHSNAWISLGAGDAVQLRDLAGESDAEGFVTASVQHSEEELTDDLELLFRDMTDWSVVDGSAYASYRYNERDQLRGWAENCVEVRDFLLRNYVRFSRISGTHGTGGMSRARRAQPFLMRGEVTDIAAGTISDEDAGTAGERSSNFVDRPAVDYTNIVGPGAVGGGSVLARCLEHAAREKGVQFMFNRHMDECIREEPFSGRVLGVRASYSPRYNADTGEQLVSYHSDGNVDEDRDVVTIRARQGVIIGTGGHTNNPQFRGMFHPGMREPAFPTSGQIVIGPRGADASGIIAGMKVGGTLAGMTQNFHPQTYGVQNNLGVHDVSGTTFPGSPVFPERTATGLGVGGGGFLNLIAVNQVGKRFFNDRDLVQGYSHSTFPGGPSTGSPNSGVDHVPYDWRNCRPEWVQQMYSRQAGPDAATAINEGSEAPHYYSGMMWAVFDQDAVDREDWDLAAPNLSETNGYFFRADTLEELADLIYEGNEYQRVPLSYLSETVETWNSYVDDGADPEFERESHGPMHRIETPPFYAASIMIRWHDSYGGLRIDGNAQVIDHEGEPIPGLYAGGEASGGGSQHGLGRTITHGYMAATHAVENG